MVFAPIRRRCIAVDRDQWRSIRRRRGLVLSRRCVVCWRRDMNRLIRWSISNHHIGRRVGWHLRCWCRWYSVSSIWNTPPINYRWRVAFIFVIIFTSCRCPSRPRCCRRVSRIQRISSKFTRKYIIPLRLFVV